MSEVNIIYQDKEYNYYKDEHISNSDSINVNIVTDILSSKSSLYITNQNHSKHIEIKPLSIQKILSNGQLEPNEYILFCFYKDPLPKSRNNNRKKEKDNNEETTEEDEEESTNTIKDDEQSQNMENLNKDKNSIILDVKNKNENIFDPKLPLLNNKIVNHFSNIENIPKKYINLIIFYNKITISIDYLKCFYLTLFFCGIFNLIYFIDILFDRKKVFSNLDNLYYISCFPLALFLMITGSYGYNKIKNNIYNDKTCIYLSYICFISPIFSFILSRICSDNDLKNNIFMNIIINFICSFLSFLCIFILKEVERIKQSEKNILQH